MAARADTQDVIIEVVAQGAWVRVTAFDPATMTEVAIVGPARAPRAQLERTVLAKLDYVIARKGR
jgi:hypothetical protein